MVVYSLMIINSYGGLVFYQTYDKNAPLLDSNEPLIIGSTLHGIHVITVEVSPVANSSGFNEIECTNWKMSCLQTVTGLKFILHTDPNQTKTNEHLRDIYACYTDYVLKNPFYTLDQPVSQTCSKFVAEVAHLIETINARG